MGLSEGLLLQKPCFVEPMMEPNSDSELIEGLQPSDPSTRKWTHGPMECSEVTGDRYTWSPLKMGSLPKIMGLWTHFLDSPGIYLYIKKGRVLVLLGQFFLLCWR